jgi:L-rhamnose isomerase / sugar isomerase
MMSDDRDYEHLAGRLAAEGHDVGAVERALGALVIETPSWGYGDSGTRFGVFPQPGRPRDVFERFDDAAQVQRVTGTAPAVATHFPWDAVEDLGALRAHAEELGLSFGAVNPNVFQDPDYKLGSVGNPDPAIRAKAVDALIECVGIATELGASAQSLWFADGTNYPGQDNLTERHERVVECLRELYAAMPPEQEMLVEYKFFEPAFYSTDIPDWGTALSICQRLGERARVLVDFGHHAQSTNVEQIVALIAAQNRLGGFHFNDRKYADDDLLVGSVNPFALFLVFCELVLGADLGRPLPRLTIDQSHNIEEKVEAMILSVVTLQEAYARALLIDRDALAAAQAEGDVLGGYEALTSAYQIDVRPLCARVREQLGAAADPIAAFRASGYAARMAAERGGARV